MVNCILHAWLSYLGQGRVDLGRQRISFSFLTQSPKEQRYVQNTEVCFNQKTERKRRNFTAIKENHKILYLLMRITMVVIIAARNTKPPNTPSAIIPPETGDHYNQTRVCEFEK